jgi:hypothetical protein
VLQRSVTTVGVTGRLSKRRRDQSAPRGPFQKGDVADIIEQLRVSGTVSKDQELDRKFDIDQATPIVFEIKEFGPIWMARGNLMAHVQNLAREFGGLAYAGQKLSTQIFKPRLDRPQPGAMTGPRQGLMFPDPCTFALIAGEGLKARDQKPRIAIWPQAQIDLE